MSNFFTFIALIFLILGFASGILAIRFSVERLRFLRSARRMVGTVRENLQVTRRAPGIAQREIVKYQPRISYEFSGGETHYLISELARTVPRFQPGDKVPLLGDPTRPEDVLINDFASKWGYVLVMSGLSVAAFLIGTGLFKLT